jgi:hypothetical protein
MISSENRLPDHAVPAESKQKAGQKAGFRSELFNDR